MKPIFFFHPFFRKSLLFSLTLLVVVSSFFSASAIGRRQLSCNKDDAEIVDEQGNTFIPRGFGLGNWLMPEGYMWGTNDSHDAPREFEAGVLDVLGGNEEDAAEFWRLYRDNYTTQTDVAQMRGWGCNTVRVSFNSHVFQPRDGQPEDPPFIYDEEGWRVMDNFVGWCEIYNLLIIWDMHGAPGAQSRDNISDSDGEARLWAQPDIYWPRAIDLWMKIAERYIESDVIAGYNLLNEPLVTRYGYPASLHRNFLAECTDSIRTIDPYGLIFVDGDAYGQNFDGLTPPWDDQVVYSFHCYPPVTWDNPFGLDAVVAQYGTPLWHGETGEQGPPYNTNTNCVNHLETYDPPIGWAWWTLKKFNRNTQPFNCTKTTGFQNIINYWNGGGAKPSVTDAKEWLFDMARKTHTDSSSCQFLPDMVASLNLNPYGEVDIKELSQHKTKGYNSYNIRHTVSADGPATIYFSLPTAASVELGVYTINGRLEKSLINKRLPAGANSVVWDRTDQNGKTVANGIYLYTFAIGDKKRISRQIVLVK